MRRRIGPLLAFVGAISASPSFAQARDTSARPGVDALTGQPADIRGALIAGMTECMACDLGGVDLSYADLPARNLAEASLEGANLSLATLDRAQFQGANLTAVNAFGLRAMDAGFADSDLSDATLVGAWLGGSNFTGARLSRANLGGANLARVSGLTQQQLDTACGDAWTVLPRNLSIPPCIVAP